MKTVRKIFWGLFFVLAAILIVFSQLGYLAITIPFMTLIGTIILAAILIESLCHINFTGIMFTLAFLGILYAGPLGITALTPWPILGVALLSSIGLTIIFGGPRFYGNHRNFEKCCNMKDEIEHETNKGYENATVESTEDSVVDVRANMTGLIKYINTDDFKVANIDASFSGVKVYLDKANIQGDSAEINVNASFAGVELYIPRNWRVVNKVSCCIGGINEKNSPIMTANESEEPKTIYLNGYCKLSGIEVIHV